MRNKASQSRIVIAGTHSGSGKTSVVTALLAALGSRGILAQPYKVGPDYIDPAFHTHVTGTPSRNLDAWLLDASVLCDLFARSAPYGEGVALIEGVMGLFDGKATTHLGSTAHVAELLSAPVVLVINARGLSRSAAALVAGYASFHPGVRVAGVICNMIKSERQYALIRESVEKYCAVPCLGYLPEDTRFVLKSRHLGLIPSGEVEALDMVVKALAHAAERFINIDALLELARAALPLPSQSRLESSALPQAGSRPVTSDSGPTFPDVSGKVRIGVARDKAFTFYYQDNFDLLESLGVELVPFSPLLDAKLPPGLCGLYFGGGFPEVFAAELAANGSMRAAVCEAIRYGVPTYAECGGMAYLCQSLTDAKGRTYPMAGVFSERVEMTDKLQHFGYAEAAFLADTILGPAGTTVRVHEFHYSRFTGEATSKAGCVKMHKDDLAPWYCGLMLDTVLAMYPHVHFYSNVTLAVAFVERCAAFGATGGNAPPTLRRSSELVLGNGMFPSDSAEGGA